MEVVGIRRRGSRWEGVPIGSARRELVPAVHSGGATVFTVFKEPEVRDVNTASCTNVTKKMPGRCCVPGCNNEIGGHHFPKDKEISEKWRVKIRRVDEKTKKLWTFGKRDVVCHTHFLPDDYQPPGLLNERRRLKRGAIPSVFPFNRPQSKAAQDRAQRKRRRDSIHVPPVQKPVVDDVNMADESFSETDVSLDSYVDSELEIASEEATTGTDAYAELDSTPTYSSVTTQCEVKNTSIGTQCCMCSCNRIRGEKGKQPQSKFPPQMPPKDIHDYRDNPKMISFYTGFSSFDHVMYLFWLLGPSATQLKYQCSVLTPLNQLFMTLIKLRLAREDTELAHDFQVSETTVSTIITTWINFLFYELKEIDIWPSKEIVADTMPKQFAKQFPDTRVILDATEIPIAKPKNVNIQSATFSTYKNQNTAKTLIGISPAGLVTFISDTYGGSTTDRQIVERSELCHSDMFSPGDSIMADRGIMVQDLFASKDVRVNTPCMLKGKTQLDAKDVVRDRRIASKRIHVERVIGLAKTYKILKKQIPSSKRNIVGRIIYICFMLANLRQPIVGKMA